MVVAPYRRPQCHKASRPGSWSSTNEWQAERSLSRPHLSQCCQGQSCNGSHLLLLILPQNSKSEPGTNFHKVSWVLQSQCNFKQYPWHVGHVLKTMGNDVYHLLQMWQNGNSLGGGHGWRSRANPSTLCSIQYPFQSIYSSIISSHQLFLPHLQPKGRLGSTM